jgi:hypothetical protein
MLDAMVTVGGSEARTESEVKESVMDSIQYSKGRKGATTMVMGNVGGTQFA